MAALLSACTLVKAQRDHLETAETLTFIARTLISTFSNQHASFQPCNPLAQLVIHSAMSLTNLCNVAARAAFFFVVGSARGSLRSTNGGNRGLWTEGYKKGYISFHHFENCDFLRFS
jgi:hypothetical protein